MLGIGSFKPLNLVFDPQLFAFDRGEFSVADRRMSEGLLKSLFQHAVLVREHIEMTR
mgnify:CR=1 FL=1